MANGNGGSAKYTLTGLKRWSCQDNALPPIPNIKSIHIYDFDNTLFMSPLPNKQLWDINTIGKLSSMDYFLGGGWWHDSNILAATGEGLEKEEAKAWQGWWNEEVVDLVKLSTDSKDALTVLLTGRAEARFSDLIKRMARSKGMNFDMVCLKPTVGPSNQTFGSTLMYKQELLKEIVYTYKDAEEIRIYEDRPKHTKAFREFFFTFNKTLMTPDTPVKRNTIIAEVIQVPENAASLDPVTEVAEIQRIINAHNEEVKARRAPPGTTSYQIKRTTSFTAYLISPESTKKLLSLVKLPPGTPEGEVRHLANSILITARPCPKTIMDKVGGIGKKVTWRVTGTAVFENKLWAARLEPVSESSRDVYTDNATPTVVLTLRRGARPMDANRIQNWHPVSEAQSFEIESTVGEKVTLRIENEVRASNDRENQYANKQAKRSHGREDDYMSLSSGPPPQHKRQPQHNWQWHGPDERRGGGISGNYRGGNQQRGRGDRHRGLQGGRGGRDNRSRGGGGGGGGNRGRGRGNGGNTYRSLDDVENTGQGANNSYPSYDDY
ncbi:hypothetical protein EJ05DRAFT_439287 [Pseudovirgaria hyperparasitica]|uniref:Swiss Army Knife RNA repair protein HAD domain-containing protein n=1 Tax=Pseudovirgaria hyperparasitica TaxID=470096 RepID=A0A6A6W6T6_9PEZI|nr:uncharacterized protein EJ05DRAFT_439287 [Pseudovirgaria hyperparasitica]KAF2758255.1 hypothetical protein EJ05DRAFT_439287 [Pseudovirgaria hyperparasitica]